MIDWIVIFILVGIFSWFFNFHIFYLKMIIVVLTYIGIGILIGIGFNIYRLIITI